MNEQRQALPFRPVLVYTMTSGLGDYIIMGDLIRKIEVLIPEACCLIVHRNNPHIVLWKYDAIEDRFFNVYSPIQVLRLLSKLKEFKSSDYTVFGLQMAPGSIQGFLLYFVLKHLATLDFIVDFNLINADIITPPKGGYILDLHLNQIQDLFRIKIPQCFFDLRLPIDIKLSSTLSRSSVRKIGIHPWSRRGHLPCFVWSYEKWSNLIKFILSGKANQIVVFGKDKKFNEFKNYLKNSLGDKFSLLKFMPSNSVEELVQTINTLDVLITVNTSVVHIAYALGKKMVILCGPSLDLWIPKRDNIIVLKDTAAFFKGSDKHVDDPNFPTVYRIKNEDFFNNELITRLFE